MEAQQLANLIKAPPMYGSYYLVKKPSGWRLMLRTYAAVDVEWDHVAYLNDESLDALQRAGVPQWK